MLARYLLEKLPPLLPKFVIHTFQREGVDFQCFALHAAIFSELLGSGELKSELVDLSKLKTQLVTLAVNLRDSLQQAVTLRLETLADCDRLGQSLLGLLDQVSDRCFA